MLQMQDYEASPWKQKAIFPPSPGSGRGHRPEAHLLLISSNSLKPAPVSQEFTC